MKHAISCLYLLMALALCPAGANRAAGVTAAAAHSQLNQLLAELPQTKDPRAARWAIIYRVQQLPQPPPTPSGAVEAAARGIYLFKRASPDNGAKDYETAAAAFRQASLLAPWVADYYYDRGVALSQAGTYQDDLAAALSFHWYLTARPYAPDAQTVIRRIGELEGAGGIDSDEAIGWVPLVWAAEQGDLAAVRSLLANGVEVNTTYDFPVFKHVAALEAAATSNSLQIVKVLIAHGASVDAMDNYGYTALYLAAVNDHLDVVQYLVAHGADVNHVSRDKGGDTVLGIAAYAGHLDIVKYLVSAGANINLPDGKDGETPLILANVDNNKFVVQFLVTQHAQVDATDNNGYTALCLAAAYDHLDMVQYLVAHGADVNHVSRDKGGDTVLGIAANNGHLDIVKYLVSAGANINLPDGKDGYTPLINATIQDKLDVVQYLMAQHAQVDATDNKHGYTALYLAAAHDNLDEVQYLVAHGADVNHVSRDKFGDTVLGIAAYNGHLDIVKYLVLAGANINLPDGKDGRTPLINATVQDKLDVVQYLVAQHARINATDHWGNTALMQAAYDGNLDIVQYLASAGAAINAKNVDGNTPLDSAVYKDHSDVAEFLKSKGGRRGDADESDSTAGAFDGESLGFLVGMLLLGWRYPSKRRSLVSCQPEHR